MLSMIIAPVASDPTQLSQSNIYLLQPRNSLSVKIVSRDRCTDTVPKVDVTVESNTIPFFIDRNQVSGLSQ